MAQLPQEKAEIIWLLKRQLLEITDRAKNSEFSIFEAFGETERTISYLDELQNKQQSDFLSFLLYKFALLMPSLLFFLIC
jgi:hypothetical protein